MTDTQNTLKAFHVAFSFKAPAQKMPGVITLVGKDEKDVEEKLLKITEGMEDVKILDMIDLANVPDAKKFVDIDRLMAEEAVEVVDETKVIEPTKH